MRQIVGAQIGTTITNKPQLVLQAIIDNKVTRLLSRQEMKIMSCLNFGPNWDNMANGPTIFLLDDDDNPHFVQTDENGNELPLELYR